MKRANQLQPLSRQHHLGLHVGRHAKECADNPQDIAEHWQALSCYMHAMRTHFKIEDNLLTEGLLPYRAGQPEVASALDKLAAQHQLLHQLATEIEALIAVGEHLPSVTQVRELATALYDHVRFEERELLPIAEQYLTVEQLDAIYKASPDDIKHLDEQR